MTPTAAHPRRARDGGFIIVAVLWILLALATLASVYAVYVVRTAEAVGAGDERVNAEALFGAAVELTAYRLTAVPKENRPLAGELDFRLGRATLRLAFRSEAGRIDLNAAPKPLLASLFVALGARPADADGYAERVIAWRTPGTAGDTEAEAYRVAGRTYPPRRGPFQDVAEIWLVLGLPAALVERAVPYLTVYSGMPQVNIVAATPLVLAALPGMSAAQLNDVLAARASGGADATAVIASLGPAGAAATVEGTAAVRVSVAVRFDNGARTGAEIVMTVPDDGQEPYRILAWRDDIDQIARASPADIR